MHRKKHLPVNMLFAMNFFNFSYNFFDSLNSKSFFTSGGIALTSGSDFNNYTDFGNYYCVKTSDVSLIKNKPKGLFGAFSMKIFAGNGTSYPTQQVIDLDGNMWIRSFVDNEWRAWSQFSRVKDS